MILATVGGTMALVTHIRETNKAHYVEYVDTPGRIVRISKSEGARKLFPNVDEAITWMEVELCEL